MTDSDPNSVIITPAVAVMAADGFLCQTAPIVKRGSRWSVLLTSDQRSDFVRCQLVTYDDIDAARHRPGNLHNRPDGLPAGFRDAKLREWSDAGWSNGDSQWFDAAALLGFCRRARAPLDDWNRQLLIALLEAAANGGRRPRPAAEEAQS